MTAILDKNNTELLKYIEENGIIDLALIQEKIEMKKREGILSKHPYSIWHNEKEDAWYTYIYDDTKPNNRKKVKRKKEYDIKNYLYEYYMSVDETEKKKRLQEKMTLEKLFYEFMSHKKNEVNSGTIKRMMIDWNRFYKPNQKFISTTIKEINKIDIDDFFNEILNTNMLKKKAFYNMCGILKQVLEYAVDCDYLEKNPYRVKVNKKKFVSSTKKPSEKEVFTMDERDLLINEMERRLENNPSNTAPLAIMLDFELGTRKGEILAICTSDIVGNRIHIHKQMVEEFDASDINHIKSKGFSIVYHTKSEDGDRWLPLTDKAKDIIERVKQINEKYNYKCEDFLFVRENQCLSPRAIDAQIIRGCEYIGIPIRTLHKIRKTYASTLLHNGVNLIIVKDMLGHADESTTLKHYIYNTENSTETETKVLQALEKQTGLKSDQSDQNIIVFPGKKKEPNPLKNQGIPLSNP